MKQVWKLSLITIFLTLTSIAQAEIPVSDAAKDVAYKSTFYRLRLTELQELSMIKTEGDADLTIERDMAICVEIGAGHKDRFELFVATDIFRSAVYQTSNVDDAKRIDQINEDLGENYFEKIKNFCLASEFYRNIPQLQISIQHARDNLIELATYVEKYKQR